MSKVWGRIGAWAAEAEREEEEERKAAAAATAAAPTPESKGFPSLREAASAKPKKTKTTLSEFTMGTYSSSGSSGVGGGARLTDYNRLTPEEMMLLPTRPKERSAEEMEHGRLGGGFSSYGRSGPPARRVNNEDSGGSWVSGRRQYGGFSEERRRPPSRASVYDQLPRADEMDNWKMTKKTIPSLDSGRQNRYGGLGTGGSDGISRANEVDNWTARKRPIPARSSTFGSGFPDSRPETDRWAGGGGRGGFREERHKFVLDPPRGEVNEPVVKTNKPNPFGAARPREVVLAEKGLDWKKLDSEIEAKKATSRPSSTQSSRSEGLQQHGVENLAKLRPKINPFGDAKPREVLLEERGQDWRKIDLELERRRMDRQETEEEKILKEEIDHLKKEIENVSTSNSESADGAQSTLRDTLHNKERELQTLIHDLENKVRVGQKVVERPSSGAGRIGSFPDSPHSQSGSSDGSRSVEFRDRPRSRDTANSWSRLGDDRREFHREFQGGRDRGFLGNGDLNGSRERW
ncbi:eukaryotic translation initiation factor 4B2-like isoform X2 [Hibiscus syriacus]|uniref:eukaryotic translation initiation factor 4B2-like isoform X2 n=1 Tax=Hibiscus syriacus TaxID=106335 RepID=UPI001922214C|nr:eukaryotic translation initiation factor 4B2-like isoform X2 [Hibiscus syriacus]